MLVKDIIIHAFKLLGREDIAGAISAGQKLNAESEEKAQTLLYCLNAVEDELARYYFPLKAKETFQSSSGVYYFEKFAEKPLRILSVESDGKAVEYEIFPKYFRCDKASVTVEYEYAPSKKELSGESAYDGAAVCESLIAAGAASEYCFISGAFNASKTWEGKYREEIDRARQKQRVRSSIPPRRWV